MAAVETSVFRQKLELLVLSTESDVITVASELVERHHLNYKCLSEIAEALAQPHLLKVAQVIVIKQKEEDRATFLKQVTDILQCSPRSQIVVVLKSPLSQDDKNAIPVDDPRLTFLSLSELKQALKLEFICLYKNRGSFFEISHQDLFPMTKVGFFSYVWLKLNRLYLPVIHPNMILSDERMQRLSRAPLFISAQDSASYVEYIYAYYDTSGRSLKKRARALFMQMTWLAANLAQTVLYDYQPSSPEKVQSLYKALEEAGGALMQALDNEESFWDLFRGAFNNDWNRFWRAPWVALYAAMITQKSKGGSPLVALMTGLLCDIGLLELPPLLYHKYVEHGLAGLSADEVALFQRHPLMSLNRCLAYKVPLSEEVKAALICTHERQDLKGFPNQTPADKIPFEAWAVQLAEQIDFESRSAPAAETSNFRMFREKIWSRELAAPQRYSENFLQSISNALI